MQSVSVCGARGGGGVGHWAPWAGTSQPGLLHSCLLVCLFVCVGGGAGGLAGCLPACLQPACREGGAGRHQAVERACVCLFVCYLLTG